MALPGIGRKTAAIILLFGFGRPQMPVDTHVHRVATRLGMLPPRTPLPKAHDLLEDVLEPDESTRSMSRRSATAAIPAAPRDRSAASAP